MFIVYLNKVIKREDKLNLVNLIANDLLFKK
jgi:hypothetical protein